ncbi:hypothetical protein [Sinomicrobium sp. M5D2P9]
MKNFTLIFCISLLLSSCNNDDDNSSPNIIGDWKMIKIEVYSSELEETDYSDNNILYQFQSDGALIVEADVDNDGYNNGSYNYEMNLEHLSGNLSVEEPQEYIVKIENNKWVLDMSTDTMTLSQAHVDGPTLFFIKP